MICSFWLFHQTEKQKKQIMSKVLHEMTSKPSPADIGAAVARFAAMFGDRSESIKNLNQKSQFMLIELQQIMKEEDYIYFAEELHEITPRSIPTSFGNIYALTAGMPGQPLILVVHGSGPKNSADQYAYLLHEYLVRISYLEKFYIVAIDCPGYGRSKGSKEAVKTFPLKMFQEILSSLRYKNYFAMLGHSQGGAAIFNAVFEEPTLTDFMVMDRPVCGNIQRFRGFSLPTLLIYDIEDDGHPIWQGKLLYKQLKNTELYTYRSSTHIFWVPDNIWETMLNFFAKQFKLERKFHLDIQDPRKNKSCSKEKSKGKSKEKKKNFSVDKMEEIKKKERQEEKLVKIEEVEKSELLSISNYPKMEKYQQDFQEKFQPCDSFEPIQFNIINKGMKKELKKEIEVKVEVEVEVKPPPKQEEKQIEVVEKQKEKLTKEEILKDEHKCAICYETLYRPITTNCNHHFCNKCILESLLINDKCPLCRAKITKKTENKELHEKLIQEMSSNDIVRREKDFRRIETMLKSIIYLEIGNTSRELQTKKSMFTKTKKKYTWELFVKQPRNFPIEEVSFNINMGDNTSRPVKIRNQPFTFESRGTFSFACEITVKPKNKEYADMIDVYRINVEPGTHTKVIALRKKCYLK